MQDPLSKKQLEFVIKSVKKWNIAHGSVRTGKTVASSYRFLQAADQCPDSQIYIVGHTFDTAYRNVVRPMMESKELSIFRPFCSWSGKKLHYRDKTITVLGAKDEGAIGNFQGLTMSLVYCDEMTLYPDSIIDMIDSRLSYSHSMGITTCNPSHPEHKIKKWIDMADEGNHRYYALHWTLEDNPYVDEEYKQRLMHSTTGLFYKRNYLGLWCMAEGAIFDFFDKKIHVVKVAPRAAEYYIAGIDYGVSNAFACVLIGVSTGKYTQEGKCVWVEKEYYWDCHKTGRQKINSEFADDMYNFLEPYGVRQIYIDPSALSMKLELQRRGMHIVEANNDVMNGIEMMTSEMGKGNLFIKADCKNLIREIENYVWDETRSKKGEDAPLKKADHAVDALRYVIATHKVHQYNPYKDNHNPDEYMGGRFQPTPRKRF
jgi:PBSX family phage terminase large subunit